MYRRPYGQLQAHRERLKTRHPSLAPNTLYNWNKNERRPAPLVVRSVTVDSEYYGRQTSFTSDVLGATLSERFPTNRILKKCSGAVVGTSKTTDSR